MAKKNMVSEETSKAALQVVGQIGEICDQSKKGVLTSDHLQAVIEHRNPFAAPKAADVDVNDRVEWWLEHYRKVYRMNPDFSGLIVPNRVAGFDRLVILPKGFKMKRWVETVSFHGVYLYQNDLDAAVPTHDRSATERAYAIWMRDRPEADEELKNLSANMLSEQRVASITLPERLVFGTAHLFQEGRHPDAENVTLCAGSRDSDGLVPSVGWRTDDRRVGVYWCSPDDQSDDLRARAVVS